MKNIPLAPMPRILIDLGNGELFPEDQIPENVWDTNMDLFFKTRYQLIDTVDQNVGEYVLNGHGRFKITREQQPFDGVCAPVVYHAVLEIETSYHKTGTLSSFRWHGEQGSNCYGKKVLSALDKSYFSKKDGKFHAVNSYSRMDLSDELMEAVQSRIKAENFQAAA